MTALGLDMDGVLYGWHESVHEYFKLNRGYEGTFTEFWSREYLKFSDEDWKFLVEIDILYSDRMPTDDCINFLNYAKYRFDLYYITSRPAYVKTTTEQYLRRHHFPFQENLIFVSDKVNTARRLRLDYFIDDLPKHLEGLSEVCKVVMIERPYNLDSRDKYNTSKTLMGTLKYLEER